jgi:PAS domain S-box-containing protein
MYTLPAHVTVRQNAVDPAPCDAFFRHVYFEAPVGIARVSTAGCFLDTNPALCALLGYPQEALFGRDFFDLLDAEDASQSRDTLRQFSTGEVNRLTLEKRYRHGAGGHESWVKVSISSWPGPDGLPQYFVYVFEDISERKAAEVELQMCDKKYSAVMDTSPEGFWLVDMAGQLLEVNDAYCRLCGYSRAELLGMNISQLDADQSPGDIAKHLDEIQWRGNLTFTSRHQRKDGSYIPLLIRTTYAPHLAGHVFSFFHDLSQQHAAEDDVQRLEISEKNSRLDADESRNLLLHISETTLRQVGEDLHDDVGQILAGAAMLAGTMTFTLNKTQQAEAAMAELLATQLNQAVGKLRAVSRGLYPVDLENAGLRTMLETLVRHVGSNTPIRTKFQHDRSQPQLDTEQCLQIYRIAQEATNNVIRHSGAKCMTVVFACRPNMLTVSITDNGFGIEHNRRQSRAGIGLRIIQARVDRIGAGLRISTPTGGGTCIELSLPLPAKLAGSPLPQK